MDALEKKLSYDDLRFYRSIARSQLKKDLAARKKLEEEKERLFCNQDELIFWECFPDEKGMSASLETKRNLDKPDTRPC